MYDEKNGKWNNRRKNTVEIVFNDAGYTILSKSNLNKNILYLFPQNFTIGTINNINIKIPIDKDKSIRIWTSHKNIQEYLNFLYICYKFEGKNISVIFTEEYDESAYSISTLRDDEIPLALKYAHNFSENEIDKYKEEWIKLTKENSELRLFKNKIVQSVNYDYLYDYISKYYDKENLSNTIGNLMAHDQENNLNDETYKYLINKLFNN